MITAMIPSPIIHALLLAFATARVDTTLEISYWPATHPWQDTVAMSFPDGSFDFLAVSSVEGACRPDEVPGVVCDASGSARYRYRYLMVRSKQASVGVIFDSSRSTGPTPDSAFAMLCINGGNFTESYSIAERDYWWAVTKDGSSIGDTIHARWSFTGPSVGAFALTLETIGPMVGVSELPSKRQRRSTRFGHSALGFSGTWAEHGVHVDGRRSSRRDTKAGEAR